MFTAHQSLVLSRWCSHECASHAEWFALDGHCAEMCRLQLAGEGIPSP